VLAHKLELTRNEQFVHNFMMDNQLTKRVSAYNCQKRVLVTVKCLNCNGILLLSFMRNQFKSDYKVQRRLK